MIRQDIDIVGKWKVIVVYNAFMGEKDIGFTYTDYDKKQSIVGISISSSHKEFFNTMMHEIKHVQSHICNYYDVDEDSEEAAYLVGYIVEKMTPKFLELIYAGLI